jgi:hypothetical protein
MILAESLTSSPSSIFWLTVALAVVTIIAVGIGFVTWRSGIIHKRLLLSVTSRSRLLSAPQSMRDDLEISYKGGPLHGDPYVTAIELANVGRSPIGSDDFDRGRPLSLGLNVPIIKVLAVEHQPSETPSPTISASDNEFNLEPELIAKQEVIKVALLTEGRVGNLDVRFKPFGDVDVEIRDREAWIAQRSRRRSVIVAAGAIALLTSTLLLIIFGVIVTTQANNNLSVSNSDLTASRQAVVESVCVNLLQSLSSTSFTMQTATSAILSSEHSKVNPSSFTPAYYQFISNANGQVKDLFGAFNEAKAEDIPVRNATSLRMQVTQAMDILARLPKDKAESALLADTNKVSQVAIQLISQQILPPVCGS